MRTYVPVVVRGKESEGVKFWGFGKQVYAEILGFIADPDYGDITDLQSGRDITVEFTPGSDGSYPSTTIRVKPSQTPATQDKNVANMILNEQKNVDSDVFPEATYDDLKEALQNWLNPEDEVETTESAEDTTPTGVTSTDDIDSAFDDLFNN